jgi:hypothetical protein
MTYAQTLIVMVALLAANLPFITRRVFFFFPTNAGDDKALIWRVLELIVLYFAVGGIALFFESRSYGGAYPQGWEFYAVTFCLFVVFAYPGFVLRYLWRFRQN